MSAAPYCPRCGALNTPESTSCFACGQAFSDTTPFTLSAAESQVLIRQRYRRLRQIGTGGFGAVYKAEDTQLGNRLVAIKSMRPHGLTPAELQEATQAFHQEALLLARLAHPHLPRIYEQFEENGHLYLVMDFIEGQTLEGYLTQRGGRLPVKEALQLGLQLTEVLGYLHTRQPPIIFRDLKPANVLRAPDGQIYLIDFGIARLFKPGQAKDTIAFGSPGYAAPEQYGKTQTTPRSDVYSLGALLHHLLTGTDPSDKPFRFTPLTMRRPIGLSTMIERMVDIDVEKRPPTMGTVRRDLERLLSDGAPWHGDDPSLTGVLPRVTRVFPSYQPYGAPPYAPTPQPLYAPAPPPAWPQQNTLTNPRPFGAPLSAPSGAPPAWPQQRPVQAQRRFTTTNKLPKILLWVAVGVALLVLLAVLSVLLQHTSLGPGALGTGSLYSSTPDISGGSGTTVGVYMLAWSPDGTQIASAGGDSIMDIWEVANPQQEIAISTDFYTVNSLAWSPKGDYLLSAFTSPSCATLASGVVSTRGFPSMSLSRPFATTPFFRCKGDFHSASLRS